MQPCERRFRPEPRSDSRSSWSLSGSPSLVYEPCLCVVAQGSKEVLLAGESYRLDPVQFLLVSVDLPVDARVVRASAGEPYVGLQISLDPRVVGELLADGSDEELHRKKLDYLHANPVRKGLVNRSTDWRWSSARWYAWMQTVGVPIDRVE